MNFDIWSKVAAMRYLVLRWARDFEAFVRRLQQRLICEISRGAKSLTASVLSGRQWLLRPWRIETSRRIFDFALAASGAIVPAGIVYLQLLGHVPPTWLGRVASLVLGLWIASLSLRASELLRVLIISHRESLVLQRAVHALKVTVSPSREQFKGLLAWAQRHANAAISNDPLRSAMLSGSAVVITYIPAVVVYLDTVPSQTRGRLVAGPT